MRLQQAPLSLRQQASLLVLQLQASRVLRLWRPLVLASVRELSVPMPQTQPLQATQKSECSSTCVCLQKHGKKATMI